MSARHVRAVLCANAIRALYWPQKNPGLPSSRMTSCCSAHVGDSRPAASYRSRTQWFMNSLRQQMQPVRHARGAGEGGWGVLETGPLIRGSPVRVEIFDHVVLDDGHVVSFIRRFHGVVRRTGERPPHKERVDVEVRAPRAALDIVNARRVALELDARGHVETEHWVEELGHAHPRGIALAERGPRFAEDIPARRAR